MGIYGSDFASAYNRHWAFWGPRVWPFVSAQAARLAPGARTWLDLCCGAGSLLTLAVQAGFEVTGLDAAPHQLRHAARNVPQARLVRADVRAFALGARFDVVTCLFDSLNYLTTLRDLGRAFRCARRHLSAGGVFIFDVNTYAGLQDQWRRASVVRDPRRLLVVETSFDERRAHGLCRITGFVRDGRRWRRFEEDHVQRGYRPEEIARALRRAGFAFRAHDGSSFGRPRVRSARLFYVCRSAPPA